MTKQECAGASDGGPATPPCALPARTADILWLPRHPEATALRRAVTTLDAAGRALAASAESMGASVGRFAGPLARLDAEGARARRLVADAAAVAQAIESGDLAAMTALQAALRAEQCAAVDPCPDRRRHRRSSADQAVTIRHRARRMAARLVDVSRGGAALTLGEPLLPAQGSAVVIEGEAPFRGGIDARVVGLGDGRLRIAFDPVMVAHGLFDPTADVRRGGA